MSKNSQLMEKHNHRQLLNANSIFGTRIWKLYLEVTSSEGSLKPKCLKTLRESLVGNAQREKHKDILLLRHQNKSAQEISFIIKKIDALNSKKKKKKQNKTWMRIIASITKFCIFQTPVPVEKRQTCNMMVA